MYKNLYFKITVILIVFIIAVMSVVGTVLLGRIFNFYKNEFFDQMREIFNSGSPLYASLKEAFGKNNYTESLNSTLKSYSGVLGVNNSRNYFILDINGEMLEGSDAKLGASLKKTPNMIAAIHAAIEQNVSDRPPAESAGSPIAENNFPQENPIGEESPGSAHNQADFNKSSDSNEYSDYAVFMTDGEKTCIIYIIDTLEDTQRLSLILFSIILQSLMFGLIAAILLAFFLSKAITMPIQNLTRSARLVAAGDFEHQIDVHSNDEIGTLTDTFNHMKIVLKNTLDEVSAERQKLETVFSHLKDAVIAFDGEGGILHINQSAKDIFGKNFGEGLGLPALLSLLSLERDDFNEMNQDNHTQDIFSQNQSGGQAVNSSADVSADVSAASRAESGASADETDIFYADSPVMTAIYDNRVLEVNFGGIKYTQDGTARDGIITVIHDITARYELDKSRREFVANVSHELRTPLTSIKGACETILAHAEMPAEIRGEFLDMAVKESDRMTNIIRDLLVLSRLDNKKTRWKIESFDINESIRHICEVMRVDVSARGHTLGFNPCAEPGLITADKERIDQVVINVLSNALKYTPDGGKIDISIIKVKAFSENDGIRIIIKDNGIGIPEEDLPRLFERFYRVEKARTSDTGGTGLGLAIAKEIIEAHGGVIAITSKLEHGSEVIITLPLETKLHSS